MKTPFTGASSVQSGWFAAANISAIAERFGTRTGGAATTESDWQPARNVAATTAIDCRARWYELGVSQTTSEEERVIHRDQTKKRGIPGHLGCPRCLPFP